MLIITRKENDSLIIDTGEEQIEITIVELGRQARIGISAPPSCRIWRKELYTTIQENKQASAEIPTKNLLDIAKKLSGGK